MYDKWEKRWRELAAEPTWAKFLQLIRRGEVINRAKLRGVRLDEDCKYANTTTEADLCVCFGLIDNAENFLPKCKECKALVWNAEDLIVKRMKEAK